MDQMMHTANRLLRMSVSKHIMCFVNEHNYVLSGKLSSISLFFSLFSSRSLPFPLCLPVIFFSLSPSVTPARSFSPLSFVSHFSLCLTFSFVHAYLSRSLYQPIPYPSRGAFDSSCTMDLYVDFDYFFKTPIDSRFIFSSYRLAY